ncbi:hypothetical protein H206_00603 [Candidatus Electrothrix aarhusensis]|uniref:Uncharacterized protein n=1 Tax=Candidatus Electrothrix aarhusensis TaxID=1859131 RepID=A0A444IXZ8_9BACT|nr:hypothetical protein H206_00603 [Candidatus Electrothrix aarhusensis]
MKSLAVICEGEDDLSLIDLDGKINMACLGVIADIIQALLDKSVDYPFSVSGGDVLERSRFKGAGNSMCFSKKLSISC